MKLIKDKIIFASKDKIGLAEITSDVEALVKKSGIKNGIVVLSSSHTTASVCVNERCERLQKDMVNFLTRLVPPDAGYLHDHETVDGRNNAHSHLMSLFLKTSEVVQVTDGKLALGTWQSIFFIELDGPRSGRTVNVMMMGE